MTIVKEKFTVNWENQNYKVLHLTLKKKWFYAYHDLQDPKTEEYREIKPYWQKRIKKLLVNLKKDEPFYILFSLGYSKHRLQFMGLCTQVIEGYPIPRFAEESHKEVFIFKLAAISGVKRCS